MYPTHYGVSGGGTEVKIGSSQLSQVIDRIKSLGIDSLDHTCRFDTTIFPASGVDYEGGYIICTSPPIKTANLLNVTTNAMQVFWMEFSNNVWKLDESWHFDAEVRVRTG